MVIRSSCSNLPDDKDGHPHRVLASARVPPKQPVAAGGPLRGPLLNRNVGRHRLRRMETDPKFFNRADAHIHLSNDQIGESSRGKVSAPMMYATARFNAWVSACGFKSGTEMAQEREKTLDYFVTEYRKMLSETGTTTSRISSATWK